MSRSDPESQADGGQSDVEQAAGGRAGVRQDGERRHERPDAGRADGERVDPRGNVGQAGGENDNVRQVDGGNGVRRGDAGPLDGERGDERRDLYLDLPQSLLQMNARTLTYLHTVARTSTFTEAAEELGISQSALSHNLSHLGQRLGVALFEQDGRRRRLTEAGRKVASYAGEVLGRLGELQTWIDTHHHGIGGTIRVGLIDAAALYLLPEALTRFRAALPDVALRLVVDSTDDLCDRLARYELDVAFAVGPAPVGLVAEELCSEELRIYARRPGAEPLKAPPAEGVEWATYPAGRTMASPDSTAASQEGVEWALYPAGSRTRALIDEAFAARGIDPVVTLTSQNPEVLRQVAAMGQAATVLPRAVGGRAPDLCDVTGEPLVSRSLVLLRRETAPNDPRVEALAELARQVTAGG